MAVEGFDISLAQTPPAEWLPANVTMTKLDMLNVLPDSMQGSFE